MKNIFKPNQISAKLLVDFAFEKWALDKDQTDENLEYRYLMVYDMYIKRLS